MNNTFLTIKEPCNQGWDNMSVSEKGKFCSACQKQVHDFSNATLDEIKKVYAESKDGLCVRVSGKLLNEQYIASQEQRIYFGHIRTFYLATVICFGASLFTIQPAKATILSQIKNTFFQMVSDTNVVVIKGVIRDAENKEPMPFVTVVLMQGDLEIDRGITDYDGMYKFSVDFKKHATLDLKVVTVGYETFLKKNVLLEKMTIIDLNIATKTFELGGSSMEGVSEDPLTDPFSTKIIITRDEYRRIPK